MTETYVPRRLPIWFGLAAASPTIMLLANQVSRELRGPTVELGVALLLTLWLATTLPLVFLVVGLRVLLQRQDAAGRARDVQESFDLITRADQMVSRQLELLQRVEALAARASAPAAAAAAARADPGATRRRALFASLAVLFLVASAGITYAFVATPRIDGVHHHASFAVFVEGDQLSYADPVFDVAARGNLNGHIHVNEPTTLHIEGPAGATLAQLFESATTGRLENGSLHLDALTHGGRVLASDATAALLVLVASAGEASWREVDPMTFVPRDRDRVLITYGAPDADALARQKEAVPTLR